MGGETTKEKHDEYSKEMPWLSLSFSEEHLKKMLEKFNVKSYPYFLSLTKEGKIV